jgi:hypothetical protein
MHSEGQRAGRVARGVGRDRCVGHPEHDPARVRELRNLPHLAAGGGLLTVYGKGIDAAQNLRPEEIKESDFPDESKRWLAYDVRLSLSLDRTPPAATGYGFDTSVRSAFGLGAHRLVYAGSISSPTLTRTRTSGAVTVRMSKFFWLFRPKERLSFVVGRDDLPTGLGLPGAASYSRRVTTPDVSSTPTQVKMFWWNDRWQVSSYGFGPDGNETSPQFEAYGVGGMVGADVWKDRAVVGVTTRVSRADAYDRRSGGVFLRLGLTEHFGVLLQQEVIGRTTNRGAKFTHLASHSEIFFVPFDWLQTALGVDQVATSGGPYSYRISPSAQVRLNRNISVEFKTRDAITGPATANRRTRTYSLEVQLKTVE